jgi:hypothetical protein
MPVLDALFDRIRQISSIVEITGNLVLGHFSTGPASLVCRLMSASPRTRI